MLLIPLLFTSEAQAFIYWGSPDLEFRLDRPAGDYVEGAVTLDTVRVHHCGSGYTDYPIGQVIDPVAGFSVPIAGGDHCAVTFLWGSALEIDGQGALGAFTVRYAQAATTILLSAEIAPVALTPYSVVSGSMSGGAPWLLASID